MGNLIYAPDYFILLKAIDENTPVAVSTLTKELGFSYGYIHEAKKIFEKKGWITIEEQGQTHFLILTAKGKALVNTGILFLNQLEDMQINELLKYRRRGQSKKEYNPNYKKKEPELQFDGVKIEEKDEWQDIEKAEVKDARDAIEGQEEEDEMTIDLNGKKDIPEPEQSNEEELEEMEQELDEEEDWSPDPEEENEYEVPEEEATEEEFNTDDDDQVYGTEAEEENDDEEYDSRGI